MARKKIEPITSLGSEDKLTVQKSLPLFALWRSELTLAEFKILDTYLSRIDSHKPEKRAVVFEKGELEKILGVKKINQKDLELRLKHLMGNVVEIPDNSTKKGFRLLTLFEEAVAEQDDYGLWQVKLECTQKAMKYFFNVENLGYLRYKLRCITSITSRYTYIMFTYLEQNRFRKSWEVSVEELKQILDCNADRYKEFKYFKTEVLARVQKEMHEKTECRYSYEPIKKGRSVVAIRFTVETLPKANIEEIDENQITLEEWEMWKDDNSDISSDDLWKEPLACFGLTEAELEELEALIVTIPEAILPSSTACYGDINLMRYHYMDQKVREINRRDASKPIAHKFAYLKKMVLQDVQN